MKKALLKTKRSTLASHIVHAQLVIIYLLVTSQFNSKEPASWWVAGPCLVVFALVTLGSIYHWSVLREYERRQAFDKLFDKAFDKARLPTRIDENTWTFAAGKGVAIADQRTITLKDKVTSDE